MAAYNPFRFFASGLLRQKRSRILFPGLYTPLKVSVAIQNIMC